MARINVAGAGIVGLWQAFTLLRQGHEVSVWDPGGLPSSNSASRLAGAMLAPFCEGEPGHELARDLGIQSLRLWQELYPGVVGTGTLVVAHGRDRAELLRFAQVTADFQHVDSNGIQELEPRLGGRFSEGLYYAGEAKVEPQAAISFLADAIHQLGGRFVQETFVKGTGHNGSLTVDCRGIAAWDTLRSLRGVRGERLVIECAGFSLRRSVRLLHPRIPFYIVPWDAHRFMIGATVIESSDQGPPTLRSVAELMAAAYSLAPELGEARILEIAAGVRPAFPDNAPKILIRGQTLFVNGLYRHGFLLAPILAKLTADYIKSGVMADGVAFEDHGEW